MATFLRTSSFLGALGLMVGCPPAPELPSIPTQQASSQPVELKSPDPKNQAKQEQRETTTGEPTNPIRLRDISQEVGLRHINRQGNETDCYSILEVMGGGIAWTDFDRDGMPDGFVLGGGAALCEEETTRGFPCELYWNRGCDHEWTAVGEATSLCTAAPTYPQGVLVSDFNEDGFEDVLVTCFNAARIMINQGDGRYSSQDLAQCASQPGGYFGSGAAASDLDHDGIIDLFLSNYCDWSFTHHPFCEGQDGQHARDICGPHYFGHLDSLALRNGGDGQWLPFDNAMGLKSVGRNLGVLAGEIDGKAGAELYVANDLDPNSYLVADAEGKYQDRALLCGIAMGQGANPDGSMGIAVGDYDRDGRSDLVITNFRRNVVALHRQRSSGIFQFTSGQAKVLDVGDQLVAWGVAFVDLDLDGWEDMPVVNGDVFRHPSPKGDPRQSGLLFHNRGKGVFADVTTSACTALAEPHLARGLAVADFDRDGRPDLLIGNLNEPPLLLWNQSEPQGKGYWVELVGTKCCRDPVGAKITIRIGETNFIGHWTSGGTYLSSHEHRLFFGLGDAERIDELVIQWPNGSKESWSDLATGGGGLFVEGHAPLR